MKSGEVKELTVPTSMSTRLPLSSRVSIRGSVPQAKPETMVTLFPLTCSRLCFRSLLSSRIFILPPPTYQVGNSEAAVQYLQQP
ncbi:hypothetical protein D3C76_1323950 [compost metagenome]